MTQQEKFSAFLESIKTPANADVVKSIQSGYDAIYEGIFSRVAGAAGLIGGSDASMKAVEAAGRNLRNLPHGTRVALRVSAFEKVHELEGVDIVCNPPAGVRIGVEEGTEALVKSFGDFLKQRCKGATAYVYLTDRALVKHIGLRTSWKKPLKNGALEGRLVRIDLY